MFLMFLSHHNDALTKSDTELHILTGASAVTAFIVAKATESVVPFPVPGSRCPDAIHSIFFHFSGY